ncbi:carcinoembryonic antigen-related cell adhesion molecule 21-like isoform X4 [Cavia porcellus]|uniref:carcinoembryonic antigen-related cell adhesion molecule 21-like isoform X4 n=1 Tax=Cavia porcellus TaxID=10141 RepID=UPI002FE33B0C
MEPRTTTSHRGFVPWQELLLTASLLAFWSPPTTAQLTIESVPFDAVEGADVLLLAHNLPENTVGYSWFKGNTTAPNSMIIRYVTTNNVTVPGKAYSGRETIYRNGSLLIQNVTLQDSGFYTLRITDETLDNKDTYGQFHVHQPVSPPSIQASNTTVTEDDSVVLTCLSNDTGISIQWIFNNQDLQLSERMKLSEEDSILTIDPVKSQDAGQYQCEVSNPVSSNRSDALWLDVFQKESSGLSVGAIVGIVIAAVAVVALIAGLAYFLFFRKTGRASDQHDLTEHKPSVSNHSLGPSDNSPDKVDEIAYSSLSFDNLQPKQPISDSPVPTVPETVYSEVKKK